MVDSPLQWWEERQRLLGSELLHEVHHYCWTFLFSTPRPETLRAVRALRLTHHHNPRPPARHLLDIHCLQLGDKALGSLRGTEKNCFNDPLI